MQDHSKLMINIEKIESRKFLNKSSSILNDPSSTDVWFHAIDPETLKIINVNDDRLNK